MRSVPDLSIAFIGVGSNIKPEHNIMTALEVLQNRTHVTGSSTFYRTEPIGRPDQPHFINGVWRVNTAVSPVQVRDELLTPVEEELGRVRTTDKFAPRTIDLDLVLYDDLVVESETLRLPHPDLGRPFVSVPILELLDSASDIESGLRERMLGLLPPATRDMEAGEPLYEITRQLRQMLI